MNDLQIFENPEFGQVRTVEIDGTPWLVGKDVAVALGYKNPGKAIIAHVDVWYSAMRIILFDCRAYC